MGLNTTGLRNSLVVGFSNEYKANSEFRFGLIVGAENVIDENAIVHNSAIIGSTNNIQGDGSNKNFDKSIVLGWSNDINPASSNEFNIIGGKNNTYEGGNNHYVLGVENIVGGTHEGGDMGDNNLFGNLTTGYNNYGNMSSSIMTGRNHRTQNFNGGENLENNIVGGNNNFLKNTTKNSLIIGQNFTTHSNSTILNTIIGGSGNDSNFGTNVREDSIIAGRGNTEKLKKV